MLSIRAKQYTLSLKPSSHYPCSLPIFTGGVYGALEINIKLSL